MTILMLSCGGARVTAGQKRPKSSTRVRRRIKFDSLAEMMATSDLSIQGMVLDVEEMEPIIWDEDAADDPMIVIDATVRVDEFLWSRGPDSTSGERITVAKEDRWGGDRLDVGQTGAFFLWESKDGTYSPIVNAAIFHYGPEGSATSAGNEQSWVEELIGLDRSGFETKLDDAVAQVARGEVQPVKPASAS